MYLVIDGIDGCGKTTIVTALSQRLRTLNITSICVREPTNGAYGTAARNLIESKTAVSASELHKLFTLDREEHVRIKINPALAFIAENPSFFLLQDRGYLSAPAYQSEDDNEILGMLDKQEQIAPAPNYFILIDTPVSLALKRMENRAHKVSIFDQEDTLSGIRRRFLLLAKSRKVQIKIIDGTLPIEEILDEIIELSGFVGTPAQLQKKR